MESTSIVPIFLPSLPFSSAPDPHLGQQPREVSNALGCRDLALGLGGLGGERLFVEWRRSTCSAARTRMFASAPSASSSSSSSSSSSASSSSASAVTMARGCSHASSVYSLGTIRKEGMRKREPPSFRQRKREEKVKTDAPALFGTKRNFQGERKHAEHRDASRPFLPAFQLHNTRFCSLSLHRRHHDGELLPAAAQVRSRRRGRGDERGDDGEIEEEEEALVFEPVARCFNPHSLSPAPARASRSRSFPHTRQTRDGARDSKP